MKTILNLSLISAVLLSTVGAFAKTGKTLICEPQDYMKSNLNSVMITGDKASVIRDVGYDDHEVTDYKVSLGYPRNGLMYDGEGFTLFSKERVEDVGVKFEAGLTVFVDSRREDTLSQMLDCQYVR